MAIVVCPIIDTLVEVPMLTSERFRKAGHTIISLQIKINAKSESRSLLATHKLDKGISLNKKDFTYNERRNVKREMKMTIPKIDPIGGLEKLNRMLKREHKDDVWTVCYMITETNFNGVVHRCKWSNKKSASNVQVRSLILTHIDGKRCENSFSTDEMRNIAGRLSENECRLDFGSKRSVKPLCTPHV